MKLECSGLSFFVRCLYSAAPMAFLCYLQFFGGEKTIVLENPNGSFYKSLKLTYANKLRAQFGCVK